MKEGIRIKKYDKLERLLGELACGCGCGVTGAENGAAQAAAGILSALMPAQIDALGNVRGEAEGEGPRILLDAHIDSIGMVVTAVGEDGFLKADKCGGVDIRVLPASEVNVWGKERLFGVITSVPPHLSGDKDGQAPGFDQLTIDTGLGSRAKELVEPGDRISLAGKGMQMTGKLYCAPALDDRAGVACILRCLELLKKSGRSYNLSVLFSVQEESGGSGAAVGAFSSQAEEGISVDVSFACAPGIPREKCGELGKGPMIGIAAPLDGETGVRLRTTAKSKGIPYQLEAMGGKTGTNADELSVSGEGMKIGLISIPLRNMHTAAEIVSLEDIENTAALMAAYIAERGRNDA